MDEIARKVFRFEEFTLDVMRRSLRHGRDDAQLRPKAFDVLCYLVGKRVIVFQLAARCYTGPTKQEAGRSQFHLAEP